MTISEEDKKYFEKSQSNFQFRTYMDLYRDETLFLDSVYYNCQSILDRSTDKEKTLGELSEIFIIPRYILEIFLWFEYPKECKEWFEEPLFIESAIGYRAMDPKLSGLDPDLKDYSYEEITPSEILQGIIRLSAGTLTRFGSQLHDDLLLNWVDENATKDMDKDALLSTYVHLVRRELILKVKAYCMIEDLMNYHLGDGLWEMHTDRSKRATEYHNISVTDGLKAGYDSKHRQKIENRIKTNESAIRYQHSLSSELLFLCHNTPSFVLKRAILFLEFK